MAVPLTAAMIVIFERLQARRTPVPLEPASVPLAAEEDVADAAAMAKG